MDKQSENKLVALIYFALALAVFMVFWQVHSFEFTNYDDNSYVSENTHILAGFTPGNIIWAFTSPHYFMWHPITTLTNLLDYQFFGLKPGWHHITNLLFHITNTLLLFAVFRKMTDRIWPSAFVAAAFALHPLNVESAAWIAERKNVVSAFFWLLTIAAYVHYTNHRRIANYLLVVLMFSLALMSKPTTVTLPFVLLLLDYWPLGRILKTQNSKWPLIAEKIPLFVLSAILCVITVIVQKSGSVLKMNEYFPFSVRLSNALVSYILYIGKMIYPLHLAVFYPHPGYSLPVWEAIVSFLTLVAVSVCVIYLGRYKPYLPVGWFWFLGTLVPVVGLVQAGSQRMADRYTYIPLIGLFIIIAWGANDLLAKWKYRTITLGVSSLVIISAIAVFAWFQTSCWRNSTTLFEHALKVTNRNHLAYNKVGFARMEQGKYDEAITLIKQALQLKPFYAEASDNLGLVYTRLNRWPDAIELFKRAVSIRPDFAEAHCDLGISYAHLGKTKEAVESFKQAVKTKPDYAEAWYGLGTAYIQLGDFPKAIEALKQTVKIKPDSAEGHYYLGIIYLRLDCLLEAIQAFKQAVEIKPDYAEAYDNLGIIFDQLGRYQDSAEVYRHVVEIKPDDAQAYNNLGIALGQLDRYQESIQALRQAIKIKPDSVEAHYNLAISYLGTGDKTDAVVEYEILEKLDAEKANMLLDRIKK